MGAADADASPVTGTAVVNNASSSGYEASSAHPACRSARATATGWAEEEEARTSGTNFHSRVRASRTHVRSSGGSGSGLDRSAYVTDAYRPRFGNSIFWTFHGYTPPSDMMMMNDG